MRKFLKKKTELVFDKSIKYTKKKDLLVLLLINESIPTISVLVEKNVYKLYDIFMGIFVGIRIYNFKKEYLKKHFFYKILWFIFEGLFHP